MRKIFLKVHLNEYLNEFASLTRQLNIGKINNQRYMSKNAMLSSISNQRLDDAIPTSTVNGKDPTKACKILTYNDQTEAFVISKALKALKSNHVIALPTDTIYGIATLAQCSNSVDKLYSIKKRDPNKPVAICVGDIEDIPKYGEVEVEREVLEGLLPGPVTLVFNRNENLNKRLNPDTKLVGIRIPNHSFIQKLAQRCGEPLALTSANISLKNSTQSIQEFRELWKNLGLIVDGGTLGHLDPLKKGSTVVDLSVKGHFKILRAGCAEKRTTEFLLKNGLVES